MWFNSIYLKSLRDFRIAILGWGLGMGLLLLVVLSAIPSLVSTPEARASLVSLAGTYAWIADPIKITTPGGYATWKYGLFILVMAIWPLLVGGRILRGEEERGSLDTLLSLPRGRMRVALEKLAAMWTALLAMGLLIGLLAFVGGKAASADLSLGNSLLFGLNVTLICGIFGSIALFLSQFTQERGAAAGWTGGLLLVFTVLDMVHRVVPNTDWVSQISPVYYYNANKPLIPGYSANPGAMLLLLGLSALLSGAAIWLFARRDVGGVVVVPGWLLLPMRLLGILLLRGAVVVLPILRPFVLTLRLHQLTRRLRRPTSPSKQELPMRSWSLRSIYTRSLATMAVPTFWWTLGIAGWAAWMIEIINQAESQLLKLSQGSPFLQNWINHIGGGNNATLTILSALFGFLPLLLMAFAITQASRWSADEEDGRLELVLATPQPRLQVILGRFAALTTATIIIGVLTLATTAGVSAATGLKLDAGNMTVATLTIIPMGLLMAAIGYLLSGWLTAIIETGLLSFLLAIWFFITFVSADFNWSNTNLRDATLHLSAFYYYGTPLVNGLSLGNLLGVLGVTVVALALASLRFMRKDIAH